jgi:uncharacterized protein YdeI (YjbR/CyaY-like superfamily)
MEKYFKNRKEWRNWLEKNHSIVDEIWLIYYKKNSGKSRIPYNDAVEEALCFGWIDGKIKRVNEDYYIQRFTPRRPGSRWSKLNLERAQKLIEYGLMKPEGLEAYKKVLEKPELASQIRTDEVPVIPEDLMEALSINGTALTNFLNFPPSARRLYILWMNFAKRAETRAKRIERIVGFAEKNIRTTIL